MTQDDTITVAELSSLRKARLLRNAILVLIVALSLFNARAVYAGASLRIAELSVALSLSIAAYYFVRAGAINLALTLLFVACWIAIVMGVLTTGVDQIVTLTWFPILVCLGGLLGGRKHCLVMLWVSLATLVAIWSAQRLGFSFQPLVVAEDKLLQARFHVIAQLVLISVIVLVFVDINVRYESKLQRQIEDLEREGKLRAEAELSARQSDQAKSAFLGNMSHEIRTPLNSIIGFSSRLIKRNPLAEPKDAEALQCILRNGKVLLSLVNELLELSNIESTPLTYSNQPFSLDDLVSECVGAIEPVAQQYGLQLQITHLDKIEISADHSRLHQILFNLMYFCIGQTREGSVNVSLTRELESGVMGARLLISDTSQGLVEKQMTNLFERHNQVVLNNNRDLPISALTLIVTDKLIALHGGCLRVISEVEQGTCFDVWLPLAPATTG